MADGQTDGNKLGSNSAAAPARIKSHHLEDVAMSPARGSTLWRFGLTPEWLRAQVVGSATILAVTGTWQAVA
jgi:hypothetical protein